jgi:hypothetical protein
MGFALTPSPSPSALGEGSVKSGLVANGSVSRRQQPPLPARRAGYPLAGGGWG